MSRQPSKSAKSYGLGNQDTTIHKFVTHAYNNITSSAGGVVDLALTMDPNGLANTDWADFSSLYDEFRVIGVRISIVSSGPNAAPATMANYILSIAFDNDNATAPGSHSQVQQYSTSSTHSLLMTHPQGKPLVLTYWRPTAGKGTTIPWVDIATPSGSTGSILLYSSALTASTFYATYVMEYFCEFRGRK